MDVISDVLNSLGALALEAAPYVLRMLMAAIVLVLGWLLARAFRYLSIRLMLLLRIDSAAEKTGIEEFLLKGGVRFTTVSLIGEFFYWGVFFVTLFVTFEILGLGNAKRLLGQIFFFSPTVFVALFILIFGSLFAQFVRAIVAAYLNNVGVEAVQSISFFAQIAVLALTVFAALEQFSLSPQVLASIFQIGIGGLALGFGIALGLGGQDVAKKIADKFYKTFGS